MEPYNIGAVKRRARRFSRRFTVAPINDRSYAVARLERIVPALRLCSGRTAACCVRFFCAERRKTVHDKRKYRGSRAGVPSGPGAAEGKNSSYSEVQKL